MLTKMEIDFFHSFGYVVAHPDSLASTLDRLDAECRQALSLAYPDQPIGPLQLPAMSIKTPTSVALVHEDALLRSVETLVGSGAILKPPKITRFSGATNWHRDCYMPLRGVKVAIYLFKNIEEVLTFNVIPASHTGPVRNYVDRLFGKERTKPGGLRNPNRELPPSVPTSVLELRRGNVLLFDLGLWHANLSPRERLQWGATFLVAPQDQRTVADTVSHLGEFFEYSKPYPRTQFPYLPPEWEINATASPHAQALASSGVLTEYLSRYGPGR